MGPGYQAVKERSAPRTASSTWTLSGGRAVRKVPEPLRFHLSNRSNHILNANLTAWPAVHICSSPVPYFFWSTCRANPDHALLRHKQPVYLVPQGHMMPFIHQVRSRLETKSKTGTYTTLALHINSSLNFSSSILTPDLQCFAKHSSQVPRRVHPTRLIP
jgi:hypothetical protein